MDYAIDLTNIEVNHFFNMKIFMLDPTMIKLVKEGVERPDHLVELNSEDAKSIYEALRSAFKWCR